MPPCTVRARRDIGLIVKKKGQLVAEIVTGEIEDERTSLPSAAAEMGCKGGQKRTESMSRERRAKVAKTAAAKRWDKMLASTFTPVP
jgi:hypothetical protein